MGGISKQIGSGNHGKGLGGDRFAPLFGNSGQPCAGQGWLMYLDSGDPDSDREAFGHVKRDMTTAAKRLCSGCPVKDLCLQYALETREAWGVWGGTTPAERGVPSPGKAGR